MLLSHCQFVSTNALHEDLLLQEASLTMPAPLLCSAIAWRCEEHWRPRETWTKIVVHHERAVSVPAECAGHSVKI